MLWSKRKLKRCKELLETSFYLLLICSPITERLNVFVLSFQTLSFYCEEFRDRLLIWQKSIIEKIWLLFIAILKSQNLVTALEKKNQTRNWLHNSDLWIFIFTLTWLYFLRTQSLVWIRLQFCSMLYNSHSSTYWLLLNSLFNSHMLCVSRLSLHFVSPFSPQQKKTQQMCWAGCSLSDHGLLLKALHSWEGNRKKITEGLNTCTRVHMQMQGGTTLPGFNSHPTASADLNELAWLTVRLYGIMEEEEEPKEALWMYSVDPTFFHLPHHQRLEKFKIAKLTVP